MSRAWPMVPLGEVLEKSEEWIALKPDQSYKEVTVRLWGKGITLRREVPGAEIAAGRRLVVHPQQFILSRIDARNGALGLVPDSLDGAIVSNDFPVFTPNHSKLLPDFLGWMSKTPSFVDICKAASEGTTNRVRLQENRFLATPLPLPPLAEQQRIVARIEALSAKIEEAKKLRQQSVKAVGSLLESKFRAVLTTEKNNMRYLPFDEIAVPERRPVVTLSDHNYQEIGTYSYGRGIFHKPPRTGFEVGDKQLYLIRHNDFILQITFAWEGAVALAGQAEDGLYGSVRYLTFRVNEDICSSRYLLVYMKTAEAISNLGKISPGSAGRNRVLNVKRLREILVPVVPRNLQNWLTEHLQSTVDDLKKLQAETAAELDALLPSILDKAFKGEL